MTATNAIERNLKGDEANRRWIFYDGECPICTATANKLAPLLCRYHFEFAPLQTPWAQTRLSMKPNEPLTEMKLLTDDGKIFGGADAVLQIARKIWWAWPLFALTKIPGVNFLLRAIYRRVAANRTCFDGKCLILKTILTNQIKPTK